MQLDQILSELKMASEMVKYEDDILRLTRSEQETLYLYINQLQTIIKIYDKFTKDF